MSATHGDFQALAEHLTDRRDAVVIAWQAAVKRDPRLNDGNALPRAELVDHIPSLLATFERALRLTTDSPGSQSEIPAAAHGLQRWQQGYNLREVTRELGKLNECMIRELDAYALSGIEVPHAVMARARELWSVHCGTAIEESVSQYFRLQQQEAAGHVQDLEQALEQIRELEQQRGELWREATHDMRGNLGVVVNITSALSRQQAKSEEARPDFLRMLTRNVSSLHHLIEDMTSLARLQAGREIRKVEEIDAAEVLEALCEGARPLAAQRGLSLKTEGPAEFHVQGDSVKIRRIAQNLLLNAIKYTRDGSITVSWGNCMEPGAKRWLLCVQDTGAGLHTTSGIPIAVVLDPASEPLSAARNTAVQATLSPAENARAETLSGDAGEGIGLSIVKRLCDLLDATIELRSRADVGTTARIFLPTYYLD